MTVIVYKSKNVLFRDFWTCQILPNSTRWCICVAGLTLSVSLLVLMSFSKVDWKSYPISKHCEALKYLNYFVTAYCIRCFFEQHLTHFITALSVLWKKYFETTGINFVIVDIIIMILVLWNLCSEPVES